MVDQQFGLETSLDFSLFDKEVAPLSLAINRTLVSIAQGVGKQVSGIADFGIAGQGEASVSLTLVPGAGISGEASGQSLFDVVFTITKLSNFTLTGSLDTQSITTGGAALPTLSNSFLFEDVDNSLTLFQALTDDEAFGISGTLPPGTYRISAGADADASQAASLTLSRTVNGISAFDFDFRIATVQIPEAGTMGAAAAILGLCGWTLVNRRRRA
ncbi:MAG: hypothetical protein JNK85_28700 [Verrucomicrobiales bacterium]|nr:hypothetical protein [Verrucomicrobiales bacterium]